MKDRKEDNKIVFITIIITLLFLSTSTKGFTQHFNNSIQIKQETEQNIYTLKWLDLTNKIMELQKKGKYKEANLLAEIAYKFASKSFGEESYESATSLFLIASSSYNLGNLTESERYFDLSYEIFQSIALDTKVEKIVYSSLLIELNTIYLKKHNIASEEITSKIIELYENDLDLDRSILAKNYVFLASIKLSQYKYNEARDNCVKSLEIQEKIYGLDNPELILALMHLSEAYFYLGEYDFSIKILERVLKIAENKLDTESLLFARILSDLSASYQNLLYYNKSNQLALKSLELKKKLLDNDDPSLTSTLNTLGINSEFGESNYPEALSYYQQAFAIEKKSNDKNSLTLAIYLENIANIYTRMGNYDKAESYMQDTISIYEYNYSKNIYRSSYPIALISLANIKRLQNKQDEARKIYEEALSITRQNIESSYYQLIIILCSLGGFYVTELDNPKEALVYIDEALKFLNINGAITYNIYDYTDIKMTVNALIIRASALTYLYMKDETVLDELLKTTNIAFESMEYYRENINDKHVKFDIWQERSGVFEFILAIHELEKSKNGKLPNNTFNYLESSISRALLDELSVKYIRQSKKVPQKVLNEHTRLIKARETLKQKIINSSVDNIRHKYKLEYIENEKHLGAFINSLYEQYPSYAQLNYPRPIDLEVIQNELLNSDKIALAYYLGTSNSFLMVITNSDIELFRLKYNKDEITKKIEQLRNAVLWYENSSDICDISVKSFKEIKNDKIRIKEISKELYEVLIEPASEYLKDKKELVVVPHSNLWLLPFEEIENKKEEYLGTKYQISYQNSFTVWKLSVDFLKNKSNNDFKFVGIGDAIYQNDERYKAANSKESVDYKYKKHKAKADTEENDEIESKLVNSLISSRSEKISDTLKSCKWNALSLSREEIVEIGELKGFEEKSSYRLGYSAAEWNLDNLDIYEYVHFSTHGTMQMNINGQDTQPALLLTQINPSDTNVDGILTMEEVINNLELNADLVVLSACETGIGELKGGEGVMSMARAFQHAGAGSVITSLWKVHEDATKKFMGTFYSYVDEGKQPKEALYLTKKDFIEKKIVSSKPLIDYSHPFFWAAFVIIGGK